jgi:hypothetical protein
MIGIERRRTLNRRFEMRALLFLAEERGTRNLADGILGSQASSLPCRSRVRTVGLLAAHAMHPRHRRTPSLDRPAPHCVRFAPFHRDERRTIRRDSLDRAM